MICITASNKYLLFVDRTKIGFNFRVDFRIQFEIFKDIIRFQNNKQTEFVKKKTWNGNI